LNVVLFVAWLFLSDAVIAWRRFYVFVLIPCSLQGSVVNDIYLENVLFLELTKARYPNTKVQGWDKILGMGNSSLKHKAIWVVCR